MVSKLLAGFGYIDTKLFNSNWLIPEALLACFVFEREAEKLERVGLQMPPAKTAST